MQPMRMGGGVAVLALGLLWANVALAQGKSIAEEILDVLRANGQITEQQYADLLGKARAEQVAKSPQVRADQPAPSGVRMGYRPGQGFHFESADGQHTLSLGGRVQTRWSYTDRDGRAAGNADESEFRLRSARLWWQGHAFGPRLYYFLQTEVIDGGVTLLDYQFRYQYLPALGIQLGQFKPGQARQELLPIGVLQFTDRSLANDFFNVGRDRGIEVFGTMADKLLHYRLGVFNGNGLNQRQSSTDFLYAGRLQLDPLGPFPPGEPELDDLPRPRLSFGISSQFNKVGKKDIARLSLDDDALENFVIRPGFAGDNIDVWTSTADAALKWRGFSLVGEYYFGNITTDRAFDFGSGTLNKNFNAEGWYIQTGYFLIPQKLEVAFRYSLVEPDRNALTFTEQDELRGALNYYFYGHNLKLQTDFGTVRTERIGKKAIDDLEARVQVQLVF